MAVIYERQGHVGILRLDDAARRNAMSSSMVREGLATLAASRRDGARAIVIASAQRWFCAGADVKDMLASGWLERDRADPDSPTPPELFEALDKDERPVLAAVEGLALGGGVELTLACDLVVAGGEAQFALPELGLGVIPNTALAKLPSLIGLRATKDLLLTRRRLDAGEAHALGLVSRLVPAGEALPAALAMAEDIVGSCPPAAIAATKRSTGAVDWAGTRALLQSLDRAEWDEGITAFLERRRPDYTAAWERRGRG